MYCSLNLLNQCSVSEANTRSQGMIWRLKDSECESKDVRGRGESFLRSFKCPFPQHIYEAQFYIHWPLDPQSGFSQARPELYLWHHSALDQGSSTAPHHITTKRTSLDLCSHRILDNKNCPRISWPKLISCIRISRGKHKTLSPWDDVLCGYVPGLLSLFFV